MQTAEPVVCKSIPSGLGRSIPNPVKETVEHQSIHGPVVHSQNLSNYVLRPNTRNTPWKMFGESHQRFGKPWPLQERVARQLVVNHTTPISRQVLVRVVWLSLFTSEPFLLPDNADQVDRMRATSPLEMELGIASDSCRLRVQFRVSRSFNRFQLSWWLPAIPLAF